jgi:hypothetical protein
VLVDSRLDGKSATGGIAGQTELGDKSVAGALDDTAIVGDDGGLQDFMPA